MIFFLTEKFLGEFPGKKSAIFFMGQFLFFKNQRQILRQVLVKKIREKFSAKF